MSSILEITKRLEEITDSDCFYADAGEILSTYSGTEISLDEFRTIFLFLEKNPDLDYGAPGPLVHFVEHFYSNEYDEALKESVKRCPTELTLWMLNRVINGSNENKRNELLLLLEDVEYMDVSQEIKNEAKSLLEYQTN